MARGMTGSNGIHRRSSAVARPRTVPHRLVRSGHSGILQTTSAERRAAGGDRPRSGGCRAWAQWLALFDCGTIWSKFQSIA